jgi:DNA-binding NtrC family response regulator
LHLRISRGRQWAPSRIDVVLLTAFDDEFTFLRNILGCAGMRVYRADCIERADFLLLVTEASILLSDVALVDCSWRCALRLIRERYPFVSPIVIADPIDHPFLCDAFTLGSCGVLWKPIEFDLATRMIWAAREASVERRLLREEARISFEAVVSHAVQSPSDICEIQGGEHILGV